MRLSFKALPLNRLLCSLLWASSLTMAAMPTLAQDNETANNQTITTVTMPQVMHVDTLVGLQALQFNLKRRHINLSDKSLLAQEVDSQLPSEEEQQQQNFDATNVSFDEGDAVK